MEDLGWQIVVLVLLLAGSGFFSSAETAMISFSKIRLRHLVEEGNPQAIKIQKLADKPNQTLGAILVGNNIVNIGASALATSIFIRLFGNTGVGIATGIMTLLVLIFGEITPKSLATTYSEKISLKISGFLTVYTAIMRPIVSALLVITKLFSKLIGADASLSKILLTEEELKTMVHVGHQEGVLEATEKEMIYNVFDFGDAQVREVMTPRADMIALEVSANYEKVIETLQEDHFSRIPIYSDNTDNIVGVLYIKDLIINQVSEENFDIQKYMRAPLFTFEFKRTNDLFKEMRIRRVPIAIVLDEYGGTAGIVTFEDLIEEIVGDIKDEYDDHEEEIEIINDHEYIVGGTLRIDEFNDFIDSDMDIESEDFDSIGGFVVGEFGYIPEVGEFLDYGGVKFVVEEVEKNRIEKLRIHTSE